MIRERTTIFDTSQVQIFASTASKTCMKPFSSSENAQYWQLSNDQCNQNQARTLKVHPMINALDAL